MAEPRVSILIPSFKPRHFEMALCSALAQGYEDREIIVSDDCPTDDIQRICERYPHVQYSRNPERRPNRNLVRLTELARGQYIKYLLDDDVLHPLCVGRMVEVLDRDAGVSLVFSARDQIDEDSRVISRKRWINAQDLEVHFPGLRLRKHCVTRIANVIGEFSTVMFRKADVLRPDGTPIYTGFRGAPIENLTDVATWLQLCERGDAVYLSEPLSLFRIHGGSTTGNQSAAGFRPALAEWSVFALAAIEDPVFSDAERFSALRRCRAILQSRLHVFPDLTHEIAQLDAGIARLQPAEQPQSGP